MSPLDSPPKTTSVTTHLPCASLDRRKVASTTTSAIADEPIIESCLIVSGPRVRGSAPFFFFSPFFFLLFFSPSSLSPSLMTTTSPPSLLPPSRDAYSVTNSSSAPRAASSLASPSGAARKSNSSQERSPVRNSTARQRFFLKMPVSCSALSSSTHARRNASFTSASTVTGDAPAGLTSLTLTALAFSLNPGAAATMARASFTLTAAFGFFCATTEGARRQKAKGKRSALRRRQKAKGKRQEAKMKSGALRPPTSPLPFAFCLLPSA